MSKKAKTVQAGKPVKTVRNVLVQPFKTKWPHAKESDIELLMPSFKQIPEKLIAQGLNSAMQLLQEAQACALFLSSDFHPLILGKQIIRMARRNSPTIPILAIDKLSWNGDLEKLIAIQKSGSALPQVSKLLNMMAAIGKTNGFEDDLCHNGPIIKDKITKQRKTPDEMFPVQAAQLYLPRRDANQRAFVPNISSFAPKTAVSAPTVEWGEYISLKRPRPEQMEVGIESDLEEEHNHKQLSLLNLPSKVKKINLEPKKAYVPLTVNRVQGNPDRKQKQKKSKNK